MTEWRPTAGRKIDRQRLRWEDDVRADLGRMKFQNWSKMVRLEKHGKEMLIRPKPLKSCNAKRRRTVT
jgi:hypothetical protein